MTISITPNISCRFQLSVVVISKRGWSCKLKSESRSLCESSVPVPVVALPSSQVAAAAWLWCPTSTSTTTTTMAMGWQTECSKALAMDLALAKALTRVVAPCLLACRWIKAAADYSNNMEIPPPHYPPLSLPAFPFYLPLAYSCCLGLYRGIVYL